MANRSFAKLFRKSRPAGSPPASPPAPFSFNVHHPVPPRRNIAKRLVTKVKSAFLPRLELPVPEPPPRPRRPQRPETVDFGPFEQGYGDPELSYPYWNHPQHPHVVVGSTFHPDISSFRFGQESPSTPPRVYPDRPLVFPSRSPRYSLSNPIPRPIAISRPAPLGYHRAGLPARPRHNAINAPMPTTSIDFTLDLGGSDWNDVAEDPIVDTDVNTHTPGAESSFTIADTPFTTTTFDTSVHADTPFTSNLSTPITSNFVPSKTFPTSENVFVSDVPLAPVEINDSLNAEETTTSQPPRKRQPARVIFKQLAKELSRHERALLRAALDARDLKETEREERRLRRIALPMDDIIQGLNEVGAWWARSGDAQEASGSTSVKLPVQSTLSPSSTWTVLPYSPEPPFHFDDDYNDTSEGTVKGGSVTIPVSPSNDTVVIPKRQVKLEDVTTLDELMDLETSYVDELYGQIFPGSPTMYEAPTAPLVTSNLVEVDWSGLAEYMLTPFDDDVETQPSPVLITQACSSPPEASSNLLIDLDAQEPTPVSSMDYARRLLYAEALERRELMLSYRHSLPSSSAKASLPPIRRLSFDPEALRIPKTSLSIAPGSSTRRQSALTSPVWNPFLEPDVVEARAAVDFDKTLVAEDQGSDSDKAQSPMVFPSPTFASLNKPRSSWLLDGFALPVAEHHFGPAAI